MCLLLLWYPKRRFLDHYIARLTSFLLEVSYVQVAQFQSLQSRKVTVNLEVMKWSTTLRGAIGC